MNQTPKISVLMPAYNTEKYVNEAIESILQQTFNDFELIIIDDCSTDNTWDVIQEYSKKDGRISIHRNEKNSGISSTRNKLISLAKGNYIVWQDSDDISLPTRMEKQYKLMEENPAVGICGGYLQFFNNQGNLSIRKYAATDALLRKNIFRFSPVAQPGAIVRKKALIETGFFSTELEAAEDLAVSFQIGSKYQFANLQEVVLKYREHSDGTTFTKLRTMEINTLRVRKLNMFNKKYRFNLVDIIYNCLQYLSIFLIPPTYKLKLFNYLRNN